MFCSVVKHLGSGRALKKWGKTLHCVSCFPLHFFRALPLPACFTTEQNTVEASLFVNYKEPGMDGNFDDCTKEVLKELEDDDSDTDLDEEVQSNTDSEI